MEEAKDKLDTVRAEVEALRKRVERAKQKVAAHVYQYHPPSPIHEVVELDALKVRRAVEGEGRLKGVADAEDRAVPFLVMATRCGGEEG